MKELILFFALIMIISSCGPTIHYLGDTYSAKNEIDIYYDANDVNVAFRVIGKMTHDKFINYELESIKEEMITKAKRSGADGIIFDDFVVERENEVDGDRFSIIAQAIRYTE